MPAADAVKRSTEKHRPRKASTGKLHIRKLNDFDASPKHEGSETVEASKVKPYEEAKCQNVKKMRESTHSPPPDQSNTSYTTAAPPQDSWLDVVLDEFELPRMSTQRPPVHRTVSPAPTSSRHITDTSRPSTSQATSSSYEPLQSDAVREIIDEVQKGWIGQLFSSTTLSLHSAGNTLMESVSDLTSKIDDTMDNFLGTIGVDPQFGDPSEQGSHSHSQHSSQSERPNNSTASSTATGDVDIADRSPCRPPVMPEQVMMHTWDCAFNEIPFESAGVSSIPALRSDEATYSDMKTTISKLIWDDSTITESSSSCLTEQPRSPLHPITPTPSSPLQHTSRFSHTFSPRDSSELLLGASSVPHKNHLPTSDTCAPTSPPCLSAPLKITQAPSPQNMATPPKRLTHSDVPTHKTEAHTPSAQTSLAHTPLVHTPLAHMPLGLGVSPIGPMPFVSTDVAALQKQCTSLTSKVLKFQSSLASLMKENALLKSQTSSPTDQFNDPLADQLGMQLQHLLQEKSKLQQEKERLSHENSNLSQLLDYACASMDSRSWPAYDEVLHSGYSSPEGTPQKSRPTYLESTSSLPTAVAE